MHLAWKCTFCFDTTCVTGSTPMTCINLQAMNIALHMFAIKGKAIYARRLCVKNQGMYFKLFRLAASHYMRTRVQPYLRLPGPVEVDETYIGRRKFSFKELFP